MTKSSLFHVFPRKPLLGCGVCPKTQPSKLMPHIMLDWLCEADAAPVLDGDAFSGLEAAQAREKATEKAKASPEANAVSQEQEVGGDT